jgi:Holliday junction DNA helicase RuvA
VIASLRGKVLRKDPSTAGGPYSVVVEANGVGYRLFLSNATFALLPATGEQVFLHAVMVVREDAILLFGFGDEMELALFDLLVEVKGIGPRLALSALSGLRPHDLAGAIARGDAVRIATVPGIGRKTAERIVLELRDKVPALMVPVGEPAPALPREAAEDVISALLNMGFRPAEGRTALRTVMEGREVAPPLDALIRECLKILSAGRLHG